MKTKRAESQKRILVLYFEKEYKDGWLIPAPVDYVQVYIYKAGYAAHVVSGVVFVFVFCVLESVILPRNNSTDVPLLWLIQ